MKGTSISLLRSKRRRMNRRRSFYGMLAFAMLVPSICPAGSAQDWVTPRDVVAAAQGPEVAIPAESFWEVRVTRLGAALEQLTATEVVELSPEDARFYVGECYRAESNKSAYLVRAVFTNSNGRHILRLRGATLVVGHASLGTNVQPGFSPLVVNLSSSPSRVLVDHSAAQ